MFNHKDVTSVVQPKGGDVTMLNYVSSLIIIIIILIIMAGMAVYLRGWLPHRGKAQIACNYCFPTRTMF